MEKLAVMPMRNGGGWAGRFAHTLNQHRVGAELSQTRLAELAGLSHSYVSRLENAERVPSRQQVTALADALECHPIARDRLLMSGGYLPESLEPLIDRPDALDIVRLLLADTLTPAMIVAVRHLLRAMVMQARSESEAAA